MDVIKLIIFDLDGTLYNLEDVALSNYKMQLNFYSFCTGKTNEEVVKVFEANDIYPIISRKSKSATDFFV